MRGIETLRYVALPPASTEQIYFECVYAETCMQKEKYSKKIVVF